MRVLVVCVQSPWPANAGAPLRTQGWLRTAARFADVGLVVLVRSEAEARIAEGAKRVCQYVSIVHEPLTSARRWALKPAALAALEPFYYRETKSSALHRAVTQALSAWSPDVVQAEWIGAVRYLQPALAASLPCVYSSHNIEHQVISGQRGSMRRVFAGPFTRRMARCERSWAERVAAVAAVTSSDADWFRTAARRTYVIPNAVMVEDYAFRAPSLRGGGPVGFLGHLRYPPNDAAARELATAIFPRLRRRVPGLQCLIAGRFPSRAVRALSGKGVHVDGDVPDMSGHWSRLSVLISPLTWGGGSRLKLLEAAALGVPIVATRLSAAGLALQAGRDYLAADTPAELAEAALTVLLDPALADAMALQARHTVLSEHDWNGSASIIAGMYRDISGAGSNARQ